MMRFRFDFRVERFRRTHKLPDIAYRAYDSVVAVGMHLPRAAHPLHRGGLTAPFFIIGAGRSGTTLLRRHLTAHPDVHIPPETRLAQAIRVYRRNRRRCWEDLVYLTLAVFEFDRQFESFVMSLREVATELVRCPRARRSLAHIVDAVYRAHARSVGAACTRWGDKTPSNGRFVQRISAVFPDAQFVHMLRDPCDVVRSSMAAGITRDADEAAGRWLSESYSPYRWLRRQPARGLTIRYEQLVTDTEATLRSVVDFLGLEFHPAMLASETQARHMGDVERHPHLRRVAEPVSASSVGMGRRELSDAELRSIDRRVGRQADDLGYARPWPRSVARGPLEA